MKKEIEQEAVKGFNVYANIFSVLFIVSAISFVPFVYYLKIYGIAIWACIYAVTLALALKVEKLKKANNVHTYKEIVAFMEGKKLDEISIQKEKQRRPYQNILMLLSGAGIGLAAVILMSLILFK